MFLHYFLDVVYIFQKLDVKCLIDFVRIDFLEKQTLYKVGYVILRRRKRRDAAACKSDFCRRAELVNHILIARFLCRVHDVFEFYVFVVERMQTIRIVPKHAKVFCRRLEIRHAFNHFVRERDTRRVGIFRNAPNALHAFVVLANSLDKVHIRSV